MAPDLQSWIRTGPKKVLFKKGNMSLRGKELVENESVNVVSLFGNFTQEVLENDPLSELLKESEIEDEVILKSENVQPRKVVSENQFPDQSLFVLEEQLANLKSNLSRMKFYLGELDDILPR